MPRFLAIALGAIAGALAAAFVVVTVFAWFDDSPPDAWNFGLGLVFFAAAGVAAVLGAILGGVAGAVAHTHGIGRGGMVMAGGMAVLAGLTVAGMLALWAFIEMPRSGPGERERVRWARTKGPMELFKGEELARGLLTCFAHNGSIEPVVLASDTCRHVDRDRIGVHGSGYDIGDAGWRWETVGPENQRKVVVRPDPLLQRDGPLLEFDDAGLLVRRERDGAPAFVVDTRLRLVERLRDCLVADGSLAALPERPRCPDLKVVVFRAEGRGGRRVIVGAGDNRDVDVQYYPAGVKRDGGPEMHVFGGARRYMLDAEGRWHVRPPRTPGPAAAGDPAPHPCELDQNVPCPMPFSR